MCLVVERLLACSKRMQSATVFPSAAAAWSPACGSCSCCMVDPRRCASSSGRGAGVSAKPAAQHVECIRSVDPSSHCQAAQHMNYFTASSLSANLGKAEWFAVCCFQLRASQAADTSCEAPVNRAAVPGLSHCLSPVCNPDSLSRRGRCIQQCGRCQERRGQDMCNSRWIRPERHLVDGGDQLFEAQELLVVMRLVTPGISHRGHELRLQVCGQGQQAVARFAVSLAV